MKRITILAAAIAAALALSAAMSLASASAATALCSIRGQSPCEQKNVLPAGTTFRTGVNTAYDSETKFELTSFLRNVKCNYSLIDAKSTAEWGNPLAATTSLFYVNPSGCKMDWTWSCSSFSANNPPATMEATSPYNGTGNVKLGTSAEPLTLSFNCTESGSPVECTYKASASPVVMTVTEVNGQLVSKITEAPMVRTAGECVEKRKLTVVGRASPEDTSFISTI